MYRDFIVLQVDGISIVGQLFLPDEKARYRLVCLCHGAPSGSPPEPGDGGYPALAEKFCREGFAACFFNFRGAGDSGGNLDFLGWTRDLQAVVDYLWGLDNIDKSQFYLVGFSAGAAVSVYVASKDERISGMAACACPAHFGLFTESDSPQAIIDRYRDIGAIRDDDFPPSLDGWFDNLKQVTPLDYVAGIAPRPLLLVHGSNDETVPVDHAHSLYEKAGSPRKLVVVDGAGHRLRREDRVIGAILDWLNSPGAGLS
ncbi:MAG: alpha/beta fold hydrolase [Dehalococcoidales bacterium]|nr:alpha/beta fold hydrolase [Dehalococcoidales bacterium]